MGTRQDYEEHPKFCLECNKKIEFKDNFSTTMKRKFCNQSCAAKYNSKNREHSAYKTGKMYYCPKCGVELGVGPKFSRKRCCDSCNPNIVDWDNITLEETREKRNYQINSRIRELARVAFERSGIEKKCVNCGYKKHVEICHIKGISEFNGQTPISEINDINNLISLCPNCHWELDHNILNFNVEWVPEEYNKIKVDEYNKQHTQTLIDAKKNQVEKKENFCIDCGIKIGITAHRCSSCLGLCHRRIERPSRDELKDFVRNQSFVSIGKQFGVSDNAIRKWCLDNSLPTTKGRIKQYSDEEWGKI